MAGNIRHSLTQLCTINRMFFVFFGQNYQVGKLNKKWISAEERHSAAILGRLLQWPVDVMINFVWFVCFAEANSVAACQETNLVANLLRVLDSTKGKGGRKLNQKRRKMVATALSVLSKISKYCPRSLTTDPESPESHWESSGVAKPSRGLQKFADGFHGVFTDYLEMLENLGNYLRDWREFTRERRNSRSKSIPSQRE